MNVGVIGLGLIGGSLARAFKRAGHTVFGDDRDQAALAAARSARVVDVAGPFQEWAGNADFTLVAVPIRVMPAVIADLESCLKPGAVVVETGSVKVPVAERLRTYREDVGVLSVHPMVGRERSGFAYSAADLFRHWPMLVVRCGDRPIPEPALAVFLQITGAERVDVPVELHDRIMASVSHLPYLISAALLLAAARRGADTEGDDGLWLKVAGSGFRDTSRVGASPAEMWNDILLINREAVLESLTAYLKILEGWCADLRAGRPLAGLEGAEPVRRRWEEAHGAS